MKFLKKIILFIFIQFSFSRFIFISSLLFISKVWAFPYFNIKNIQLSAITGIHFVGAKTNDSQFSVAEGKLNFHAGGLINFPLNKKLSLESGVLLSRRNIALGEVDSLPSTLSVSYLDIPIHISFPVSIDLYAYAGGVFSVKIQEGSNTFLPDFVKFNKLFNMGDFGIQYKLSNKISVKAGVQIGFQNIFEKLKISYPWSAGLSLRYHIY